MKITQITMLKDAKGYTNHLQDGKGPRLVCHKAGDEPVVSDDLAVLWVASGTCELRKPESKLKKEVSDRAKAVKAGQAKEEKRVAGIKKRSAEKRTKGKAGTK